MGRGSRVVGLTAGASAPEELVDDVIEALGAWIGDVSVLQGREENISSSAFPPNLRELSGQLFRTVKSRKKNP